MQIFITFAGSGRFDFMNRPLRGHQAADGGVTAGRIAPAMNGRVDKMRTEQKTVVLRANEAMLVPAGRAHQYAAATGESWEVGYLGISGGAVHVIAENCGLPLETPLQLRDGSLLEQPLRDIWEIADGAKPAQLGQASRLLYDFLLLLAESRVSAEVMPQRASQHLSEPLQRATVLMHEHFCEPLLISNLAAAVGYSVQHFQRLFRQAYGLPPHAYLKRLRMQQAALWMEKQPELPVSELAGRFNWEPHYFIRVFRSVYRMTPGEYKQKLVYKTSTPKKT
jgi:AraC-like DNA-binding protein